MVLLKGFSEAGFAFFTNQASRKGVELAAEPRCALLFPWHPLERQVRVEGTATVLPDEDVTAYFASRPRGSRLGAHASHQSRVVASRDELAAAYAAAEAAFPDHVPVPEEWGGYRVRPEVVEFWQGRPGRMHDRLVYRRTGPDLEAWRTERLAPERPDHVAARARLGAGGGGGVPRRGRHRSRPAGVRGRRGRRRQDRLRGLRRRVGRRHGRRGPRGV